VGRRENGMRRPASYRHPSGLETQNVIRFNLEIRIPKSEFPNVLNNENRHFSVIRILVI
jgi:hypothetical protein